MEAHVQQLEQKIIMNQSETGTQVALYPEVPRPLVVIAKLDASENVKIISDRKSVGHKLLIIKWNQNHFALIIDKSYCEVQSVLLLHDASLQPFLKSLQGENANCCYAAACKCKSPDSASSGIHLLPKHLLTQSHTWGYRNTMIALICIY